MEFSFINSNTTYSKRVVRSLNDGLFNLKRAQNRSNITTIHTTYYLLKDGKIVSHREWRQMNNPFYIVVGTKKGCECHWIRMINLQ